MAKRKAVEVPKRMIGRYIVADPAICHGQPIFRGTRILVGDVIQQVAAGIAWETIVEGVAAFQRTPSRRPFGWRVRHSAIIPPNT